MRVSELRAAVQRAMPDHRVAVWVSVQVIDEDGLPKRLDVSPEVIEHGDLVLPMVVDELTRNE